MASKSGDSGTINIEQTSVGGALNAYWIHVPTYQRDYAWERGEVQEYLDDITIAIANDDANYFLGTIVTIRRDNDALEVVDGQQRLATTALTLAAMKSIVEVTNTNFASLISNYLTKVNSQSLEHELKMALNVGDNPVFHSLVVSGEVGLGFKSVRASHQRIKEAYQLAKTHFVKNTDSLPPEAKIKWYQRWFQYIEHNTKVILMKVSSDATAFRMFETLNDRGLEVSRVDLIKNYIFGKSEQSIVEVQGSWNALREVMDGVDERDSTMNFIWHVLIATTGSVEQKNIYERVKQVVKGKQTAVSTVSEWSALTPLYIALENPESSQWTGYPPKIQNAIKALNILNIQQFKPLLLAIAKRFSTQEAAQAFDRIVAMGVRLFIASRTTTQSVWLPLSEAAHKVWKKEILDTKAMVTFLSQSIPNDQQFRTAFETATVTKSALARYYLRALHAADAGQSDPSLVATDDHEKLNLEHVLPLNPMGNWPQFSDEESAAYVKRIGNLALLQAKLNSDSKSDSFDKKKEAFMKSKLPTTAMIANEATWNVNAIEQRQKGLAELALKAWPLK